MCIHSLRNFKFLYRLNFTIQRKCYSNIDIISPIRISEKFLILTHDISGFEWYGSLLVSTIILRSCIGIPFSMLQIKNIERLIMVNKEMSEIIPCLKQEVTKEAQLMNLTFEKAKNRYNEKLYTILNTLYIRDNCHPAKSYILPLAQFPFWISISLALRYLSIEEHGPITTQLESGGLFSFTNLCVPDPYFVLPILLLISNLTSIQFMYGQQKPSKDLTVIPASKRIVVFKWVTRCSALLLFYISTLVPSALSLYWFYSSVFGIAQNLIIKRILKAQKIK